MQIYLLTLPLRDAVGTGAGGACSVVAMGAAGAAGAGGAATAAGTDAEGNGGGADCGIGGGGELGSGGGAVVGNGGGACCGNGGGWEAGMGGGAAVAAGTGAECKLRFSITGARSAGTPETGRTGLGGFCTDTGRAGFTGEAEADEEGTGDAGAGLAAAAAIADDAGEEAEMGLFFEEVLGDEGWCTTGATADTAGAVRTGAVTMLALLATGPVVLLAAPPAP